MTIKNPLRTCFSFWAYGRGRFAIVNDGDVGRTRYSAARNTRRIKSGRFRPDNDIIAAPSLLLWTCLHIFGLRTCLKAKLFVRDFPGPATKRYCDTFYECYLKHCRDDIYIYTYIYISAYIYRER